MIKRRFYKHEHGDRNDDPSESASSSSSSSAFSDSDSEAEATGEQFGGGGGGISAPAQPQEGAEACSTSSGYESEDSSANEVDIDSSGLPINDEDAESGDELQMNGDNRLSAKCGSRFLDKQSNNMEENELLSSGFPACVLKCKAVFKCRICPRIVCLNEETLRAHLKSKRHSRSEKLLNEGRLKATLNSDGEIDNEETPMREKVELAAVPQVQDKRKREKGGRQRQHRRRQNKKLKNKKVEHDPDAAKTRPIKETPAKKRRKHEK